MSPMLWAGLMVVSGCATASDRDVITPDPTSLTLATGIPLDCNAIDDVQPPPSYIVVLDRVALPAPGAPALQTSPQQDSAAPLLSNIAKTGLGFKAGTRWSLHVAPDDQDPLRIGWGSPGTPTTSVLPPPRSCSTSSSGWLWHPGGYWTYQPGCYTVVVDDGARSERVPVGVGARCPGQEPPLGSSAS